jgi:hypothetical protein
MRSPRFHRRRVLAVRTDFADDAFHRAVEDFVEVRRGDPAFDDHVARRHAVDRASAVGKRVM